MSRASRAFIGLFQCMACGKSVRVYDWLPQQVLCATCFKAERKRDLEDKRDEEEEETSK